MSNTIVQKQVKPKDMKGLLAVIEKKINALVKKHGMAKIDPFVELLEIIGEPEYVKNLIKGILSDAKVFQQVFNRYYHHQNGFDKLVLIDSKEYGWKLRLHIWWEKAEDPDMYDIHDHSADFASRLLCGGISNIIYSENPNGRNYYHYKYAINHKSKTSMYIKDEQSYIKKLAVRVKEKYLAGDIYDMSYSTLHRAEPLPNKVTSTIVIKCKDAVEYTSVYKEHELLRLRNIPVETVGSKNKLKEILTNLSAIL